MDFKAYLQSLKKSWPKLVQAATAISMTIAGFVKPPAYFDPVATISQTKHVAIFIIAILIAIFFYLGHRWPLKKHAKGWSLTTLVFLVAVISSELVFREFRTNCLCRYDKQPVLIGIQLTTVGQNDLAKRAGIVTCEDLLMDFQGRANLVWSAESISRCRRLMTIAYWSTFSLAGLTVLSALQIVQAYQRKK